MWQSILEIIGYLLLVANVIHAVWMVKRVLPVDRDMDTAFCTSFNLGMAAAILAAFPFRFMAPLQESITPWAWVFIALGSLLFHLIYNAPILDRAGRHHEL